MNTLWQCAVCETVNQGGRSCMACGAPLTRRSAAATVIRSRLAPLPPPPAATPLAEPVRRAINREPIDDAEWLYDESNLTMESWPSDTHRPRSRFAFWGPVPTYSTRTRGGSDISVGGCGCCLPIPIMATLGTGGALWAAWRRLR
jgi:hypothetical protein